MANEEIARIFERMARLLAFKNANRFRIIAYERAAGSLRNWKEDLAVTARENRLRRISKFEQERRGTPDGLLDLMAIPGLGPRTLHLLHDELGVSSLAGLRRALDSEAILRLRGFGAKKAGNLRRGIRVWQGSRARMPVSIALPLAEDLLSRIRQNSLVIRADIAGSLRRGRDTIGDLDVLITSGDAPRALAELTRLPVVRQVTALGDTKASILLEGGIAVDVRAVAEESYGAALCYFTGSKEHNVHLRSLARKRGWKINEYGLFAGSTRIAGATEEQLYRAMGLDCPPPEIREDSGEFEAANRHRLPKLIEYGDLRGDLHVHTDYSDGADSMETMTDAAERLGYDYIAFSDHSPAQRLAHGLSVERVEEKLEHVARLRQKRHGRPPEILMGAEVDILADGGLDYPDAVLRRLDVVITAIHGSFRQSADRMTGRILDALDHAGVHILAHPMARLFGSREPIQLDFARVIRRACERRVALEINGSYLRLDLDAARARAAQEAGALLVIGSDAHGAATLRDVRYGLSQARRGWVPPASVINTWPWARLAKWLRRSAAKENPHAFEIDRVPRGRDHSPPVHARCG